MRPVALVLAAGAGRRFGGGKLTAPFRGEPLLTHAIRAARAAPVSRVLVVAAPDLPLGDWPGEPAVEAIRLSSASLSQSLKAGLTAAAGAEAALVFLGDMPLIPHEVAGQLLAALGSNYAAMPRHGQAIGHPVLLSGRALADAAQVEGDHGAGRLLRSRADVTFVEVASADILRDVDTLADLQALDIGS